MTEFRIGDQAVHYDRDATVAAYAQLTRGDADCCPCSGCRNFALQRDTAYPQSFLDLLNTLGVDPSKEGEAVLYGPKDDTYLYGGWFYFVGEVIEKGESIVSVPNRSLVWC